MTAARKIYIAVGTAAVLALAALWLQPRVESALAPEPRIAHVAVEVRGAAAAVVGPVEIPAGERFRLHAVLEADTRAGDVIYYSEAAALMVNGEVVGGDRIRRWDRPQEAKILWFTVESQAPFALLEGEDPLADLSFEEFFHPEWSTSWQIEGHIEPRHSELLGGTGEHAVGFGTQRFRAWVEIYDELNPLVPAARFRSAGADTLPHGVDEFPTVTASLPGPAQAATVVFGLIGLELPEGASLELRRDVAALAADRLVFTRLSVLRDVLARDGRDLEDLPWNNIELDGGMEWGATVRQGDLVRVGARLVMLHEDLDGDGRLGGADSCLDFEEGAAVRRLNEVFPGEGEIEWASLQT